MELASTRPLFVRCCQGYGPWMGILIAVALVGCEDSTPAPNSDSTSQTAPVPPAAESQAVVPTPDVEAADATSIPPQESVRQQEADEGALARLSISHPSNQPYFPDDEVTIEITQPKVTLSELHAASSLVKLTDAFPDLKLTTLDGATATWNDHAGASMTMVVFWSVYQPMSLAQVKRLPEEFAATYGDVGLKVVAINVGDPIDEVQRVLSEVDSAVTHLYDANGEAFHEVATGYLPRTYLVRSDGTVVWFDLEYSRSSRRELRNAILWVLKQNQRQASSTGSTTPLM